MVQRIRPFLLATLFSTLCFVSGVLTPFVPLPLFHLALTRGVRYAWLAAGLGFVAVFSFEMLSQQMTMASVFEGQQGFRLVYYCSLVLLALFAAIGVRKNRYPFFAVLAVTSATLLFFSWALVVQVASHGMFYTEWRAELIQLFQAIAREQTQGAGLGLEAARLTNLAPQFANWLADLFPALFYSYTALLLALNVGLARRMPKLHRVLTPVRGIAQFRNPESVMWVLLVSGFVFFANEHSLQIAWLKLLSVNLLFTALALYAAQGLGVWTSVLYFLRIRRFFRQVLFMLLVFSLQFALPLLVGVGLVDVWWDWRAKMRSALKN